MSKKSERKIMRKELVKQYQKDNPPEGYDAISKRVNDEIAKLGKGGTFADLAEIDNKLGLPRGTSWEIGGFADYYAFEDED
jgi:hypothetical protein